MEQIITLTNVICKVKTSPSKTIATTKKQEVKDRLQKQVNKHCLFF